MSVSAKLAAPLVLASLVLAGGAAAAQTAPASGATAYGNWIVNCRDRSEGKKACVASLRINDAKTKKVALLWQIGESAGGKPTYVVRTPLGVRLKDGVRVALDGGKPHRIGYLSCNERGCTAVGKFEEGFAKELAGAKEAVTSFTLVDGQVVNVALPLDGIDKALPALKARKG